MPSVANNDMALRAALIGCGKIGSEFADDQRMKDDVFTHADAYSRCIDTTLVAICDTDPLRLERCGRRWKVESRYQDVQAMMNTVHPDLVSICTPDTSHYQVLHQVLTASNTPRGVLCEKPLANDMVQARDLIDLCKQRGIVLMVNYMRRFAENINALRSYLSDGNLGEIQAVNGWYTKGTLHNGSHWFDLLRFLIGEVAWVDAIDNLKEPGQDPTLDMILGLENGVLATLRAVRATFYTVFEMEILGTKGRVQLSDSCFKIDLSLVVPSPRYSGYVELAPSPANFGDRRNLALHAVEDLVDCVHGNGHPACSGEDGLKALAIGLAARKSSVIGEKVALDE